LIDLLDHAVANRNYSWLRIAAHIGERPQHLGSKACREGEAGRRRHRRGWCWRWLTAQCRNTRPLGGRFLLVVPRSSKNCQERGCFTQMREYGRWRRSPKRPRVLREPYQALLRGSRRLAEDIVLIDGSHIAELIPTRNCATVGPRVEAPRFAHRILDLAGAQRTRLDRAREKTSPSRPSPVVLTMRQRLLGGDMDQSVRAD